MLAQLADLAASVEAGRLERALRLLALEAAAEAEARPPNPGAQGADGPKD